MLCATKSAVKPPIWLFAALILLGNPVLAADQRTLSAHNSAIKFSVQILGVIKKSGQFTDFNGRFERQSGSPQKALVWLSIRSDSAQMRSKKDTEMVKGDSFFAAAQFPEVRFDSEPFDAKILLDTKTSHAISGHLSLRGKRLPETLNLKVLACVELTALEKCSFQVNGKLDRARYGMQSHRAFVGDDVRLSLTIHSEGEVESGKAQGELQKE